MFAMRDWMCLLRFLSSLCLMHVVLAWPAPDTCSKCSCEVKRDKRPVRHVNCSSRGLTTIPDDLPEGLDVLDLSNNNIDVSQLSKLDKFEHLKTLSIAYNNITTVPKMIFSNASKMQEVDMTGNILDIVDDDTFKDLIYLRVIKGLETKNILQNSFKALVTLDELHLTLHQQMIPEDLFGNLSLNKLYLNVPTANSLPLKLFQFGSKTLAFLEINGPNLHELHEDIFHGLSVLHRIALHTPGVNSLPSYLFHEETSDNSMPVNLVEIVINGVKSLPRHIFRNQLSLERLEIHGVEDLPSGLFYDVRTLDYLDLSGSDVYYISPNWFSSLSSLKTLILADTSLQSIDVNTFRGLNSLTTLDISDNNIQTLMSSVFQHFKFTLIELNMTKNEITDLPNGVFKDLRSLEKLDMSSNRLSKLGSHIYWDLRKLTELYMQNNELTYLPNAMLYQQANLMDLNLAKNNLATVPKDLLSQTRSLRVLDISGNRLGKLPEGFLSNVLFLEELKLYNNPLNCDCDMMLLKERMNELRMYGNCSWPPELIGVSLSNLVTKEECHFVPSASEVTSHNVLMYNPPEVSMPDVLMSSMTLESTTYGPTPPLNTKIVQTTFEEPGINHVQTPEIVSTPTADVHPSTSTTVNAEITELEFGVVVPDLGAGKTKKFYITGMNAFYIALAVVGAVCVIGASIVGVAAIKRRRRSRSYMVTSPNQTSANATVASDTDASPADIYNT